jgi:hypothetical protein
MRPMAPKPDASAPSTPRGALTESEAVGTLRTVIVCTG